MKKILKYHLQKTGTNEYYADVNLWYEYRPFNFDLIYSEFDIITTNNIDSVHKACNLKLDSCINKHKELLKILK